MPEPNRLRDRPSRRSRPIALTRSVMKIKFAEPALPKAGVLVILAADGGKLSGLGAKADEASDGHLGRAIKAAKFEGKREQMLDVVAPAALGVDRILVVGTGEPEKLAARDAELLGGAIAGALQSMKVAEAQ